MLNDLESVWTDALKFQNKIGAPEIKTVEFLVTDPSLEQRSPGHLRVMLAYEKTEVNLIS